MKKLYYASNTLTAILLLSLFSHPSDAQNTKYGTKALFFNTTGTRNAAFGSFSLYRNTTGSKNTAIGEKALKSNITGYKNSALGQEAMFQNTCGYENTAIGQQALYSNTIGNWNTGIGNLSLYSNTQGSNNTALGYQALWSNSTGGTNTAIGAQALISNTTGSANAALGEGALGLNTTGYFNTAVGARALKGNITADNNTAVGADVLYLNVTGTENTAIGAAAMLSNYTGSWNTAMGCNALWYNRYGSDNVASGYMAMYYNTEGDQNTASGNFALYNNISGSNNTASGFQALHSNEIGDRNTAYGVRAGFIGTNFFNTTALGFDAITTASNQVRIGNSSVTSIGGYVNWSNISDGRYKENVKEDVPGLKFINALKPITYNLKVIELDGWLRKDMNKTGKEGKSLLLPTNGEKKAIADKERIVYSGFAAQEVEKAAKALNYDFSGVDAPKNDHDVYGLRYADFVVPLVKAVQELSAENEKLKSRLNKIEQMLSINGDEKSAVSSNGLSASSNKFSIHPNPSKGIITVLYNNSNEGKSQLNVYDITGRLVFSKQEQAIKGNNTYQLNLSNLKPGIYYLELNNGSRRERVKFVIGK